MMEALGSVALTAGTLFGYNRKNFMYDRRMRQEQEFTTAEMRLKQADLWREDVRDITEMTGKKMDTYLVVNALQLGFTVTIFVEGRLEQGTPQWLLCLYMLSLSGAFVFLLLSVWLAMHASVVTASSSVRILTQLVRPPVPSWEQLESMRTYASAYEAVPATQMLRVPIMQTVAEGSNAGAGGYSGSHDAAPGSVATDPWGLERRGDDLYELARRPLTMARHVKLLREASKHWKAYDAFARASMSLGSIMLCKALGYFVLGYALINDGAPWAAWTVMGLLMCIASTILRMDMSMTRCEYARAQVLLVGGPLLACISAADWATWSLPVQRMALLFLPAAFLLQALFLMSFLRLCRVVEQPCGSMLPTSFRSVLYLDIFGWLTRGGKPKSSPVAEGAENEGYDAMPLLTCADVCDVVPFPCTDGFEQTAKAEGESSKRERQVQQATGENIEPRGPPMSFSPPSSTTASDKGGKDQRRGSDASPSRRSLKRRLSHRAMHGQNFPRHFDSSRPVPLRPEDVELAARGPRSPFQGQGAAFEDEEEDSEDEGEDSEDEGEEDGRFQGVGPVGMVPEASAFTFDPSTFAPDLPDHPDGSGPNFGDTDPRFEQATGRDLVEPGRLPWHIFRSAVRLLAGLSIIGCLWATAQACELPDIPDKVMPESVAVSGEKTREADADFRGLRPPDKSLPPGQRILAKWPSERFEPRGLSSDPTGRYFAISDEFDIYFASLTEEARPGTNSSTFRLDTFEPAPHCPALEGQANRDVAVLCEGGNDLAAAAASKTKLGQQQEPHCKVVVLHARGHRVAACELSPGSQAGEASSAASTGLGQRRLLEADDKEDHVWTVSDKWLRDLGDGSKREEVISVIVDTDCEVPQHIDERDSCVVVGTNHGRMVELRRHLSHNGELVPSGALWNVFGKAALAEQVEGGATSLLTAIPGGFLVALRGGQRTVHAIDVEKRRVVGKWKVPQYYGRTWTAIAGGATHLYLANQGGACSDIPEAWVDSKGYTCEDYITKKWCTTAGEYGPGWHMFWGEFGRYKNLEHTATSACCACGGGDREDTGARSQIWRFPLPEELRVLVAERLRQGTPDSVKSEAGSLWN